MVPGRFLLAVFALQLGALSGARVTQSAAVFQMEALEEGEVAYLSSEDFEKLNPWLVYKATVGKLSTTLIDVDFRDISAHEALAFLQQKTGVPMVDLLAGPNWTTPTAPPSPITLQLKNQPAKEVLRYVTALVGAQSEMADGAVLLKPYATRCGTLMDEDFPVQLHDSPERIAAWIAEEKRWFEQLGIGFLPGTSLRYDASKQCLIVRNTEPNLDRIAEIWDFEAVKMTSVEEQGTLQNFRKIQAWKRALAKTRVNEAVFHDASMEEVVQTLRVHVSPWVVAQGTPEIRLELSARNTSLLDLLQKIADTSGTRLVLGSRAIVFIPARIEK